MNLISQKKLKENLDYDPLTGWFTWKVKKSPKTKLGARAGTQQKDGRRYIRIDGIRFREHRLAFLYMKGFLPDQVDHIDHDPSNNIWANLRESCYETNNKNHPKTTRNTSGVVGVSQRKDGKYVARIYVGKRHKFLGSYDNIEDAKAARLEANFLYNFHPNHGM